jgi:hypothetical protein
LTHSDSAANSSASGEADLSKVFGTMFAAWLVPGAGHFMLGRRGRGLSFFLLVLTAVVTGFLLNGNLYRVLPDQPLTILATLGSMGMGAPYFFLRFYLGYQGDLTSVGYEYGTAFLLTAGLMNLLLVMDAWDIARGRKE